MTHHGEKEEVGDETDEGEVGREERREEALVKGGGKEKNLPGKGSF